MAKMIKISDETHKKLWYLKLELEKKSLDAVIKKYLPEVDVELSEEILALTGEEK